MKERPILYSAPMVLAKLAGRKTQTRRIIRVPSETTKLEWVANYPTMPSGKYTGWAISCDAPLLLPLRCPYGVAGDRLWGRETHAVLRIDDHELVAYRASCADDSFDFVNPVESTVSRIEVKKWKPSIFMPRWASRLLDEVVSVRVERLQDITEADAIAEGIEAVDLPANGGGRVYQWPTATSAFTNARDAYLSGWDTINGKGSAAKNPWVWVITTRAVVT